MDIGKKIKMLRAGKSITQEKLAQELGVTPQAVSRWENGSAMPDISLLPALSVYFGVRIDDFFELSDDAQFDRIDNMVEQEDFLSRGDFDYAERFLKDHIAADPGDARSLRALAHLYHHRADSYKRKALPLVKRALELEPEWLDAAYSMAFCYEELGDYEKACDVWEKIADDLASRGFEAEVNWPRSMAENCRKRLKT